MVSVETLLSQLPPDQNVWVKLKDKQNVDDIIAEVLSSHKRYASYYDKIALYFNGHTVEQICKNLYDFCIKNISYWEEKEKKQTTALPTGLLNRQYGDCKHFSTFCGGILDALNRITGKQIEWCYRFASYDFFDDVPHHVFVVANDGKGEIWIDPTPSANIKTPFHYVDHKPDNMALYTQIAGVETVHQGNLMPHRINGNMIGSAIVPVMDIDQLNFDGSHKYANAFGHYLGLSGYADYVNSLGTDFNDLAAKINAEISKGPDPTFEVTSDFVKWVFDNSIRSWNFYYHGGVVPGFSADPLLPPGYPRPVITQDGRLTFDHDAKLDDYRNGEIHLMTAWLQSLINDNSTILYPLKPRDVKLFSQAYTGNPNNPNANFFHEWRGSSVFEDIGKGLEKALNFVKEGVLLVVGSIPRNAFLGLVGLNVFNFAHNLDKEIQAGKWDHISHIWKSLGGNPDKLLSTINHGKDKKAVLGNTIGQEPVTTSTAALIAAATPIIAALMAFLNKDGKLDGVVQAAEAGLKLAFPKQDFGFLDNVLVDRRTGNPVQWQVNPVDDENKGGGNNDLPSGSILDMLRKNPMVTSAGVGIGAYFITNKKGKKKNYIIPAAAAILTYFFLSQNSRSSGAGLITDERIDLMNWANQNAQPNEVNEVIQVFGKFTDQEVQDVHDYLFNYLQKGLQIPQDSPLYQRIQAISTKYDIFT